MIKLEFKQRLTCAANAFTKDLADEKVTKMCICRVQPRDGGRNVNSGEHQTIRNFT